MDVEVIAVKLTAPRVDLAKSWLRRVTGLISRPERAYAALRSYWPGSSLLEAETPDLSNKHRDARAICSSAMIRGLAGRRVSVTIGRRAVSGCNRLIMFQS